MSNVDVEVADQSQQEHQHSNEGTSVAGRDGRPVLMKCWWLKAKLSSKARACRLVGYYV